MAVDADWSDVRDWEQLHEDEYEFALTRAFCTAGWSYGWFDIIGMNSITESNWREVWARFAVMQGLGVIGMTGKTIDDKVLVTKSDIERRIGLHTNYSNLTRSAWQTKKLKVIMDIVAKNPE
jgi:hypothetical protein